MIGLMFNMTKNIVDISKNFSSRYVNFYEKLRSYPLEKQKNFMHFFRYYPNYYHAIFSKFWINTDKYSDLLDKFQLILFMNEDLKNLKSYLNSNWYEYCGIKEIDYTEKNIKWKQFTFDKYNENNLNSSFEMKTEDILNSTFDWNIVFWFLPHNRLKEKLIMVYAKIFNINTKVYDLIKDN